MRRLVRITLWSSLALALLVGAGLLWAESELRAEALARRLPGLLADAGIKGSVARAEGSIDGSFTAENVDLTLADGTRIKAAAVKGDVGLLRTILGTYFLESLDVKGLEVDLGGREPAKDKPVATVAGDGTSLPAFILGPYSVTGKVSLADGTVVRFGTRGESLDTSGDFELRAGLAWPGVTLASGRTEPRGELVLDGAFARTLGGHGTSPAELARDIARLSLNVRAKDAGPTAAGSMELNVEARPAKDGLSLSGSIKDSAVRDAARLSGRLSEDGRLSIAAELDVDPSKFGILSDNLPGCRVNGSVRAVQGATGWSAEADVRASWADLSKLSPLLARGSRSDWTIRAKAEADGAGLKVEKLELRGHGIAVTSPAVLRWKSGPLPEDSSGAALTLSADKADLTALNPFLAPFGVIITAGRWSGDASVSFLKGRPEVTGGRTHVLADLAVTVDGEPVFKELNASFPLISKDGTITLSSFEAGLAGGRIAGGTVSFTPGEAGSWKASADMDVDLAALTTMPGWEKFPADKLKGLRAAVKAEAAKSAGGPPTVNSAQAGITRQGAALLSVSLRQPYPFGGPKPTGTLLDVSANALPLESLSALLPGLGLAGEMRKAELAVGYRSEGLFIRTEGAPVTLADASVSWKGKPWARRCDFTAGLEILLSEKATTIGLNKAVLRSRGRTLAAGDITIGLGAAPTTLELAGDLGGLGDQPFADVLSVVTAGSFKAKAKLVNDGVMMAAAEVADVVLRESPVRVSSGSFQARYTPSAEGFDAEGGFRLVALGRSEGKFTLRRRDTGQATDWQATVDVPSVIVDDFLALLPKSQEPAEAETTPPKPDREPFWSGHTGSVRITVGKVDALGIRAETIEGMVVANGSSVSLPRLTGRLAGGAFSGKAALLFQPRTSGGPYVLGGEIKAAELDLAAIGAAFPATKNCIEGKGDLNAKVTAVAGTAGELAGRAVVEASATSKGGRLRAFGDGSGKTAGIVNGAGEVTEVLGALAILGGALGKSEKATKIGAALSAAAKLQKAVSDFRYDQVEIKAERLASGTLKLTRLQARNGELDLTANGAISMNPMLAFSDRPLLIDAQLRGRGEFADYFQILGFAEAVPSPDGLTLGPGVKVSGSLNDIRNDLSERIQSAINKRRSEPQTQPAPTQPPGNNAAPGKRPNPLNDLLRELGR
ncbi:MAG: hypothetical protein ACO3ND_01625 [Opitutales bacterium]